MTTVPSISVIIPVFNEERMLPMILEVFRSWGRAQEVIVVDDGSTDKTKEAIAQFLPDIHLISYKRNRGKGYAVSQGINRSRGDILLLFDGDVYGLTHRDLDLLTGPIIRGTHDMSIGLVRFWTVGNYSPFDDLSGQRALWRKDVIAHSKALSLLGYGVELYVNDLYKNKRIARVKLPFVSILRKVEKQSVPHAVQTYIRETKDLMAQYVKGQARDGSAHVKPILRDIQRYLKTVFDYLLVE